MKRKIIFWFIALLWCKNNSAMNFVTVTDKEYYKQTVNLIATLHLYNFYQLNHIAVFDIGLTAPQRTFLNSLSKVNVYDVEKKNPYIFEHFVIRNWGHETGRKARGWYSWKPVVLKQACDMFDDFIFIDSGISVICSLGPLYTYLQKEGYFFIDCGHDIKRMTTQKVRDVFALQTDNKNIMNRFGIAAGYQGITRAVYDKYILPLYHCAEDISLFEDDGSAPSGFGYARHDQTLFSIFAYFNNFYIFNCMKRAVTYQEQRIFIHPVDFIAFTRDAFDPAIAQQHLRFKPFTSNIGQPLVKINKRKYAQEMSAVYLKRKHHQKNGRSEKITTLIAGDDV